MSRSQPYRPRIPTHIIQLLDVASRITLFLVDQRGPLCFTFKDRLDNKYKTSIGPQLKCSCAPGRNDHCIHTAYIFIKIFRVSVDNPIIWQAAYVDSELSDLLTWKHTMPEARRQRATLEPPNIEVPELPSEYLKKKDKPTNKVIILSQRMLLQSDSVCPICQEGMDAEMCLTFCKVKCGNNFHLECLKVWARHKVQEDVKVSCPMCRSTFPQTVISEMEQEEREYAIKQSEKIKIQFNCSSCGLKNIPNNPHKCLLCTAFELCEVCYAARKHIKHPFVRRDADGRWRGAEERRDDQLKLKNYIDSKRKQTYNDEILKKLRKIDEDPNKLIDFVAAAYPYVSRYITEKIDPLKKMDFDPTDIRCFKCGGTRMLFLRRLACGHFIDHECLKDSIAKEKYYCQEDGSQFLKGYENLKMREKEIDRKRNHQMINLTPLEFDPTHLERDIDRQDRQEPNSSDYNFVSSTVQEQNNLVQILSGRASRHSQYQSNRVGQRLASNIIRESPNGSLERQRSAHRSTLVQPNPRPRQQITRVTPKSRERPPIPRHSDIRIRNVANSNPKPKVPLPQQQKVDRLSRRAQMTSMIEALVGRKLK